MDTDKIIELISYTIPSVIVGAMAFYFFHKHFRHAENMQKFKLHKAFKKESFPIRLQAYERMVLFLERINPNKLLIRIQPTSDDKIEYLHSLVTNVEQEFEHNLSQQIYMSDDCWDMIVTAKNTTLQLLRNKAIDTSVENAKALQAAVLKAGMEEEHPSETALTYIKSEVAELF
jgi:hypothetical protein